MLRILGLSTSWWLIAICIQLQPLESTGVQDCIFHINKESGSLRSPNFPQKYPHNITCLWTITVPAGRYVKLTFGTFDVEAFYSKDDSSKSTCIDIVEVKDGGEPTKQLLGGYCNLIRPTYPIISSSNQIRVWFNTDESINGKGFNASFTSHVDEACGGVLRAPRGVIQSPRFHVSAYPNDIDCKWVIEVDQGKYIRLTFIAFDLEVECIDVPKCQCRDTLTIWDGAPNNETLIGSYCRHIGPVHSKSNRFRLKFVSDSQGRQTGFKVTYATSLTPGCGWDIEGSPKMFISSPYYPSGYPPVTECIWRIKAPPNHYISIRFTEFVGVNGSTPACPMDHIEIRDGYRADSSSLARVCNLNQPGVIVSSGNEMRVHFQSSLNMASGKFVAVFRTHSRECNASLGLEDGRIDDTQLSASSYYARRIGALQYFYHLPRFGRLHGPYAWCSQNQGYQMFDAGEYLQVDLRNLTRITAMSTQGYEDYVNPHLDFITSYKIEYSFDGFYWVSYSDGSVNSTRRGYTEFIGNSDSVSTVKRTLNPPIIANMIRIIPTSYRSFMYHICLRAEVYGCPYKIDCGGTISMKKPGKIVLRGHLRQETQCTWVSMPIPPSMLGIILLLDFSKMFDVPCSMGYVQLEEQVTGKSTRMCDQNTPVTYAMRATHQLVMKVKLKKGTDNIGFDMMYSTESFGCGDIIHISKDGTLSSPRYPSEYGTDQTCIWVLSAKPGAKVKVQFEEFSLQPPVNGSKCLDFLEIRDGQLDSSALLDTYCGTNTPPTFTSTANYMRITFHSDLHITAKGFMLRYEYIPPAGEEQNDDSGGEGHSDRSSTKKSVASKVDYSLAVVIVLICVGLYGQYHQH